MHSACAVVPLPAAPQPEVLQGSGHLLLGEGLMSSHMDSSILLLLHSPCSYEHSPESLRFVLKSVQVMLESFPMFLGLAAYQLPVGGHCVPIPLVSVP